MPKLTQQEQRRKLKEIALAESALQSLDLQQLRNAMKLIELKIKEIEGKPEQLRNLLKDEIKTHVAEYGADELLPEIEFRKTKKLMYDKDAALTWSQQNGREYVRVKESLDVRKFEEAIKRGSIEFDAEEVNVPIIAIGKLGHLLIVEGSE